MGPWGDAVAPPAPSEPLCETFCLDGGDRCAELGYCARFQDYARAANARRAVIDERPCGCRTENRVFMPCADHVVSDLRT